MLAQSNIQFDEVHTSLLRRCIRTSNIALMEIEQEYIPVYKHWRLNERSYGNLVGLNKKETVKKYGIEQVKQWRRSYDIPPPPMAHDHPYHPSKDPRYQNMIDQIPKSESLKDTLARSIVYWETVLVPALQAGKTVLVVGHENCLRSLIMNLEQIPKEQIIELSFPRAIPLAYQIDVQTLQPIAPICPASGDNKYDDATQMLRAEWLTSDDDKHLIQEILSRDHKMVYDIKKTDKYKWK